MSGSEATQAFDLTVTGSELSGALSDDSLNEDDLAAGLYDAAAVELWLVDWSEPSLRVQLAAGSLGEVKREGTAFTAEVRGITQRLAEDSGRLFTAGCSADLGDARCKVDLGNAAYRGSGSVAALTGTSSFTASGLDGFADGWFTAGKLTFTSGANAGLSIEVKTHRNDGRRSASSCGRRCRSRSRRATLSPSPPAATSAFRPAATASATRVNFRGFPQIPGNDFVVSYPVQGEPGIRRRQLVRLAMIRPSSPTRSTRAADCRRGARLDRHALSASGLAQRRGLRLPRAGARGLARGDRRRAGTRAALCARLGGGARAARRWPRPPRAI